MMLEWLKLVRTPGLGPTRIHRLWRHFGNAKALLKAPRTAWEQIPGLAPPLLRTIMRRRAEVSPEDAHRELERLTDIQGSMLILGEPHYPRLLQEIPDPPPLLFALGNRALLNDMQAIAIVGSRRASPFGRQFAFRLGRDLAQHGLVTVSGLALGIDTAAHWGALDAPGATVAVLATGLDVLYPASNASLRQRIIHEGCLITEAPLGTPPAPYLFPPRNRIVSGLSRGVAVVEAGKRSGSLITARMALEQNRDLFAVPAQAGNPRTQGGNHLLRQGALLLEGVSDILQALSWDPSPPQCTPSPPPSSPSPPPEKPVFDRTESTIIHIMLQHGPIQGDDLARRSHLTVATLSRILLQLELVGVVQRLPGNQFVLHRM